MRQRTGPWRHLDSIWLDVALVGILLVVPALGGLFGSGQDSLLDVLLVLPLALRRRAPVAAFTAICLPDQQLVRAGLERSGLRVAAVLGVALGTTYAWFGVKAASIDVFETAAGITIPWGQIALILGVSALAGLAACVLPARRAARIAPAAGLVAD
jgi:hypothetical protein